MQTPCHGHLPEPRSPCELFLFQVLAWEDLMAAVGHVYGHDARSVQPLNGRTLDYCEYA